MAAVKLIRSMRALHARFGAATAVACVLATFGGAGQAFAQLATPQANAVAPNSQMQLEADSLTYNNDSDVVTAEGSVRINYGGNRLVADKIVYDRKSGRLMATGGVELFDREGTRFTSEEADVTDDFANGFVNALRVETVDKTYFAAESAKREAGHITTFNNGVYTACAPCEAAPNRPPIWRVKSQTTIWNGQTKKVRFLNSRFELFGLPIAYVPVFEIPDPTVKRTSGFLFPYFTSRDELGVGMTIPYYFALSPTYDLTVQGTYYTKQGFLGQAEFRQRFNSGQYSVTAAGIHQQKPAEFDPNRVDRGSPKGDNFNRGMIGTQGLFAINPAWRLGWNYLAETDKDFASTYSIMGYNLLVQRNELYLTGLYDRSYFDLRAMDFKIQEAVRDDDPRARDKKQPSVLPSLDYSFTPDEPIAGGELQVAVNARAMDRTRLDAYDPARDAIPLRANDAFVRGLDGQNGRLTAEIEWKRSFIAPMGVVVTPLLAFQADGDYVDTSEEALDRVNRMATKLNATPDYTGIPVEDEVDSAFARAMATLGLELRWPVLFSTSSATHILEPMAQVFARPNEPYLGRLGLPNEDSQSFVFDATTLFERDKFAGFDRIEGGTRANVGLRYSGDYGNGWATNAVFGQSYQLAGENSFDAPDLVNAGAYSGLETRESDLVGLVGFSTPFGLATSVSGRFDENSLEMRRGEVKLGYTSIPLSLLARYAYIQAQPLYGFRSDRQEVSGSGVIRFAENWSTFATGIYDLERAALTSDSFGVGYNDECFGLNFLMSQTRDSNSEVSKQYVGFSVSFRTVGTFGSTLALSDENQ